MLEVTHFAYGSGGELCEVSCNGSTVTRYFGATNERRRERQGDRTEERQNHQKIKVFGVGQTGRIRSPASTAGIGHLFGARATPALTFVTSKKLGFSGFSTI